MSQSTPYRQTSINYRTQHSEPAANTLSLRCIGVDNAVSTYFKPAIKLLFLTVIQTPCKCWWLITVITDSTVSDVACSNSARYEFMSFSTKTEGLPLVGCVFRFIHRIRSDPTYLETTSSIRNLRACHEAATPNIRQCSTKNLALICSMPTSNRQRFQPHQLPISRSNQHVILQCLS
jgi:hypothetical protein